MNDLKNITTRFDTDYRRLLALGSLYQLFSRLFSDGVALPELQVKHLESAKLGASVLSDQALVAHVRRLTRAYEASSEPQRTRYTRMFGLVVSPEAPPYEVEYDERTDLFWRSRRLSDISGVYRAFGARLAARDRPDHFAIEMEFMWWLIERLLGAQQRSHSSKNIQILEEGICHFWVKHLGAWADSFIEALREKSTREDDQYYLIGVDLLEAFLENQRQSLGLERPAIRPPRVVSSSQSISAGGCEPASPNSMTCGASSSCCGLPVAEGYEELSTSTDQKHS